MAKSVNKVILIGNLGKDPEVKYTQGGMTVARFSMATTDRVKTRTATGRTAPSGTIWSPFSAQPKSRASI